MTAETAELGTATTGKRTLTGRLAPEIRTRQAETTGFFRILREGGAKQGKPAPRPRLEKKGIGEGKVACLRLPVATRRQTGATHRQVKERFVGPLARLMSGQGIGRIRWRAKAGRCGGEAQVIEDLPDLPAGRQATAGRSITAMTFIVPPHWAQRRGSTS